MTKADKFRAAVKKVEEQRMYTDKEIEYMSDMSNWCVVHATKYMPLKRRDGAYYIPSTAMATDFDVPRSTVHVTLNHIVASHGYGSWDDMPIVVLAPYNEVVKQNGNPAEVAGTDTYWAANPDTGLVLSKNAYVVQPDNNGPLYQIGEHGATYKRDNYTDEEIKMIESMLSPEEKEEYDKYASGDVDEWNVRNSVLFVSDKRVKKMYESAKDKKAFLRGLFEEARFDMLSHYLRNIVTRMAIEKVGYHYINSVYDANETSRMIADVAEAQDIPSNATNKGHSNSIYAEMEYLYVRIADTLHGSGFSDIPGILDVPDFAGIYDVIKKHGVDDEVMSSILSSIVENKPIDFEGFYQKLYADISKSSKEYSQSNVEQFKDELDKHTKGLYKCDEDEYIREHQIKFFQDRLARSTKYVKYWDGKTTIAKFDKNLGKTIRRHCEKLNAEFEAWRNALSKRYGYDKFIESLRSNFYGDNKAKNWYAQSGKEM
ncbi:MAG: hypothetical protein J6S74_02870 [Alphaproteobacteria bacterium]|nr:hypothetical protein [Alphaproteobacteria bacterium]